jgi:predicted ATPase
MPLSKEVRLLQSRWNGKQGWPQRLEWIEIQGIRGWAGQRVELQFPIVAIVGENGVGKSTILQAIAATFDSQPYPSDFFPDTPWEKVTAAEIRTSHRDSPHSGSVPTNITKLTERWRGLDRRKKDRPVRYIDLGRIQPMGARIGYARIAKGNVRETAFDQFDVNTIERFSRIMGRDYTAARLSLTNADEHLKADRRKVPIVARSGASSPYSGFHSGAGEIVLAELLPVALEKFSILLIDEIETSLHPRTQRRLIRDIATLCRQLEMQCVVTTHSPYILDELPPEGRIYLMETDGQKRIISHISPAFAMSKMDDEIYPEIDAYVEDERSATMLNEIVSRSSQRDLMLRFQPVPFGAANVGRALGTMCKENRFKRPTVVFLDGDQEAAEGCSLLPGGDAPERVVFEGLLSKTTSGIGDRLSRSQSDVTDAISQASLLSSHHDWVKAAADRLSVSGDVLWQAMCAEWVEKVLPPLEADKVGDHMMTVLVQRGGSKYREVPPVPVQSSLNDLLS